MQAQFESLVKIFLASLLFFFQFSWNIRNNLGFADWLFKPYICQLVFLISSGLSENETKNLSWIFPDVIIFLVKIINTNNMHKV